MANEDGGSSLQPHQKPAVMFPAHAVCERQIDIAGLKDRIRIDPFAVVAFAQDPISDRGADAAQSQQQNEKEDEGSPQEF